MSKVKKRIQELIQKLENGSDVQKRDMKNVMTANEIEAFDAGWKQYLDEKHGAWHEHSSGYDEWLKKGDLLEVRAKAELFKNSKASLMRQAEKCYAEAYAHLANDIALNPIIEHSYDRSINDVGVTYDTMARRKTSKSSYNQSKEFKSREKRDFKIRALKASFDDFENRKKDSDSNESESEHIKKMLANLKNRK